MTECTKCGLANTGSGYSPLCLDCRVARTSAERAARSSRHNGNRKTPTRKKVLIDKRRSLSEDFLVAGLERMLFQTTQEVVLARILADGKKSFDVVEYQEMWHRGMYRDREHDQLVATVDEASHQLAACPHVARSLGVVDVWEFTPPGLVALRKVELPSRAS